jgi:hypothetical protein
MSNAVIFNNLIELDDPDLTEVPMNALLDEAGVFSFSEDMVWVIFSDHTSIFVDHEKKINHIQDKPEDFPAFLLWLASDESPLPDKVKKKMGELREKAQTLVEQTHGA